MASPSENKVDDTEVTSEPSNNNHNQEQLESPFPLSRQTSIYSLTLDEIQNTVCDPRKSFGSMNMDEFLSNIWSVEEAAAAANDNNNGTNAAPDSIARGTPPSGMGGGPPLHRQGSITLLAPLCRKTVDEVWADIHGEQEVSHLSRGAKPDGENTQNAHRQPTLGEMTLEDFLIKAGVVREGLCLGSPHAVAPAPMHHNYGLPASYPVVTGPMVGPAGYEYHGKRYGNGHGMQNVGVGSPISPVSEDGYGGGQVDNSGLGGNGIKGNGAVQGSGRKRGADGGVEKVVERRQRRMIKNRESASRSRARKLAYTVELEAELNLLKEENARLREEERRAQAQRKQMIAECMAEHARANAAKAARSLHRHNSGP